MAFGSSLFGTGGMGVGILDADDAPNAREVEFEWCGVSGGERTRSLRYDLRRLQRRLRWGEE